MDTLIVWESLDIQRLELRNPTTGALPDISFPLCRAHHIVRLMVVGVGLLGNAHDQCPPGCSQRTACAAAPTASVAIRRGWGATRLTGVSAATAGLLWVQAWLCIP